MTPNIYSFILIKILIMHRITNIRNTIIFLRRFNTESKKFQKSPFIGVKFNISVKDAENALNKSNSILSISNKIEQTPLNDLDNLNKSNQIILYKKDTFVAKFIPFHTAKIIGIKSHYDCKYGIDKLIFKTRIVVVDGKVKTQVVSEIETTWYHVSGTMNKYNYFPKDRNMLIYAGFKYPRHHIEDTIKLHTKNIDNLYYEDLVDPNGKKYIIDKHEMKMGYGVEKIINSVYIAEKQRIKNFIMSKYDADHVKVNSIDLDMSSADITLLSLHLPAYIYTLPLINKDIHKIVCGNSGKVGGIELLSPRAAFIGSSTLGFIISLGLLAQPLSYPLVSSVLMRSLIYGFSTGFVTSTLTKISNWYKIRYYDKHIINESKYNQTFEETKDDNQRKTNAENFNENENNDLNKFNINLIEDSKYIILGLDPGNRLNYTLTDIKKAYRNEINKYHPDKHKSNNNMFYNEITIQINNAYGELVRIYKN